MRRTPAPPAKVLLESLIQALSVVEETRHTKGLRHPVINVLTIAVLGCMCGCHDAEALEDWGEKEYDWLSDFLHVPHGTPSQDVFLRVFAALEPTSFRMAFHAWMQEIFGVLGIEGQIAIDGQTHRRSGAKASGKKPLHMVHALLCEAGLVLGQVATDDKSNEIVAIPTLLDMLDLRGALVSIDAMGTQVKTANQIIGSTDGDHGRIEVRTYWHSTDISWFADRQRWPGLGGFGMVIAERTTAEGKTSVERRYYITSFSTGGVERFARACRGHWSIENRLHWVLDIAFDEDHSRTRKGHAAENLASIRHVALNLLKQEKTAKVGMPLKSVTHCRAYHAEGLRKMRLPCPTLLTPFTMSGRAVMLDFSSSTSRGERHDDEHTHPKSKKLRDHDGRGVDARSHCGLLRGPQEQTRSKEALPCGVQVARQKEEVRVPARSSQASSPGTPSEEETPASLTHRPKKRSREAVR
jgi:predicted transposase YbfD/YdcC